MIIPYQDIEKDTLKNLIEEFATRDGNDNGYDQSLGVKVGHIMASLKQGEIVIVYDPNLESVNIIPNSNAIESGLDSYIPVDH